MQANTVNRDPPGLRTFNPHPHGTKSVHGREAIFRFQKARDLRGSLGQRPQHDGTMRDGLVPGHPRLAAKSTARLNLKCELAVVHGLIFPIDPGTVGGHPEPLQKGHKARRTSRS